MDNKFIDLLRYYRSCLADSERNNIDSSSLRFDFSTDINSLRSGTINFDLTSKIFEEVNKKSPIDVLLIPLVFNRNTSHEQDITSIQSKIIPFIISAKLMTDGKLSVPDESNPWIPRIYLEPTLSEIALGNLDDLDAYLSKHKKPPADSKWADYWSYCDKMLYSVTGSSFENVSIENFTKTGASFIMPDNEIKGTKYHILKLYDHLLTNKDIEPNPLFKSFVSFNNNNKQKIEAGIGTINISSNHYGQVNNRFPLSNSQREAVNYFNMIQPGEIFAINGPPGTGKTTLLHSVIAQMVVEAAISRQDSPPIIVATSNNNQAVTNIIDSLEKVSGKDDLSKRWLPEIVSYGLYMLSASKLDKLSEEELKRYHTLNPDNLGFPQKVENEKYVSSAKEYFIKCYKDYYNKQNFSNDINIGECIEGIYGDLNNKIQRIKKTLQYAYHFYKFREEITNKYGSMDSLLKLINQSSQDMSQKEKEIESVQKIFNDFNNFRSSIGISKKAFEFVPWIGNASKADNKEFFEMNDNLKLDIKDFSTTAVKSFLYQIKQEKQDILQKIKRQIGLLDNDKMQYDRLKEQLVKAIKDCNLEFDCEKSSYEHIMEHMDITYRYEAFHLSIHYFEAKWIQEEESNLKNSYEDRKSVAKQKAKLRRYAKLTPCFVSTFYMLPRFFSAWEGKDKYLHDFIDLLVIDEAGQVSPEVAAACFTLAKSALVVGDVLQIEPVWGITETIDRSNMKRTKITGQDISEEDFIDLGMAASSGNVMKIAQRACNYEKYDNTPGMYLIEHRRCVPEIIEYCNELAYKGKLTAERKNDLINYEFPHLGHINIAGKAEKVNTSWRNVIEAESIVTWILTNKDKIIEYYQKISEKPITLSDCIGVVTPFTSQANVIEQLLKKSSLQDITVGTVHKFQGAERNIILFSTVYTTTNKGSFFFDKKVNMLNVAVSRAKDSFIVFGDKNILKKDVRHLPSGLLAAHIKDWYL